MWPICADEHRGQLDRTGTPYFSNILEVRSRIPPAFGGQRSIQLSYGRAMRLDSESARWQQWPCEDGGKRRLLRQRSQVRILSGARVGAPNVCREGRRLACEQRPPWSSACGYAASIENHRMAIS